MNLGEPMAAYSGSCVYPSTDYPATVQQQPELFSAVYWDLRAERLTNPSSVKVHRILTIMPRQALGSPFRAPNSNSSIIQPSRSRSSPLPPHPRLQLATRGATSPAVGVRTVPCNSALTTGGRRRATANS